MGKPSNHPEFKVLYFEWNKKLNDSGFKDIEVWNGRELVLKKTGTEGRFKQAATVVRENKAHYYEIIGQKIQETTFDSEQEKQILCLYFEGHTQAEIKKKLDPPLHRSTIYKKLYKYLRLWKLK